MNPGRLNLILLPLSLSAFPALAAETAQTLSDIHVQAKPNNHVGLKKMEKSTETDLKGMLAADPAVHFGGGNGTAQRLNIRGMGENQIDVKVDNISSDTQIFHHNSRFLLDPALLKSITVQKGTGSASAGIGATGGAITAQTVSAADLLRDGQPFGFKSNIGISSNLGWSRGATVYGKKDGWDALLSGNWITERDYKPGKGYQAADGSRRINNSGLGQRGLLAKLSYDFNEHHKLTLSHRQEKTYGQRNLREEFDFASDRNSPRYRTLTQNTTNLEYKGQELGVLGSLSANIYHFDAKREEFPDTGKTTASVKTDGANIGLDTPFLNRHTLKYGLNWRHQKSQPNSVSNGGINEKKTDVGLYAEAIWDWSPLTLTTGLRYDGYNATYGGGTRVSGHNINPSIGAIYDVLPNLSLKANLNYASHSPRLAEVALSGGGTRAFYTADDNLKAERARNAEIGFNYRWNDALTLEGSYFRQVIKDVQAVSNSRFYNSGTVHNNGYEFQAAYRKNALTARMGVAYSRPKADSGVNIDDLFIAIPVGRTWTTGLAYHFAAPDVEIGWNGRFVQASDYTVLDTAGLSNVHRSGYGVHDIYANWKPTGKDNWHVNFAVNNVGNKLYRSHSQRSTSSSLPEAGRDFRLSVGYRF